MVNRVFHQSPFTQDSTKVQKGMFSSHIALTWLFMASKAADTLPDKIRNIYTTFNLNYSTGPSLNSCENVQNHSILNYCFCYFCETGVYIICNPMT